MAVIRINKNKDFTVMSNTHFREKEMSLKAKGLLSLMLSLPDDWDYSIAGLAALSKDGKDSVMKALQELEDLGYLTRTKLTSDNGRFAGYSYDVFEKPNTEKSQTDKPYSGKPNTEKSQQYNTNKSIIKKPNKNKSITKECESNRTRFSPPSLDEVNAYCIERKNNVDAERFIDYYTANGWRVGKNPMKDWRATVRNWERTNKPKTETPAPPKNHILDGVL